MPGYRSSSLALRVHAAGEPNVLPSPCSLLLMSLKSDDAVFPSVSKPYQAQRFPAELIHLLLKSAVFSQSLLSARALLLHPSRSVQKGAAGLDWMTFDGARLWCEGLPHGRNQKLARSKENPGQGSPESRVTDTVAWGCLATWSAWADGVKFQGPGREATTHDPGLRDLAVR